MRPITKSMKGGPQFPARSQNSPGLHLGNPHGIRGQLHHPLPVYLNFLEIPRQGSQNGRPQGPQEHPNENRPVWRFQQQQRHENIKDANQRLKGPGQFGFDTLRGKEGSQPDLVISPQVPCPMKQRAAVMRRVQCN